MHLIKPRTSLFTLFFAAVFVACSDKDNDSHPSTLFTLLTTDETGIAFSNQLTEGLNTNILMYEYFYNGAGVAAGDFNGDGLTDLYFSSNMGDNKFYLNKGDMKFEDITDLSGAGGRPGPWKTGVNAVDVNGDEKLDLFLCYSGAMPAQKRVNQLFINTGNDESGVPRFDERAAEFGLASTGFSNQSYFLDYDRDGDLDMLLLNHNPKNLPILNVDASVKLFNIDNPEKGLRLFQQANGKFVDVTIKAGINGSELSYGLGLGISDFNDDGWPDFYISNDYSVPDFLYINKKNGSFTNELESRIGHISQFSMGNDVADINNDGLQDIYTLDMLPEDNRRQKLLLTPDNYSKFDLNVRSGFYYQYMRNMLHVNNGNGTFSETGQLAGVSNTDWSWAALLADYDNDGWKDLLVTNGYTRDYTNLDFLFYMNSYVEQKGRLMRDDVMEIVKQMPSSNVVNYVFRNNGGQGFENKTAGWGMNQSSNSNGAVYADLDNDGDLDVVVNNINQPAFVYANDARKLNGNKFLQITLRGEGGNTSGIGAAVRIFYGDQVQRLDQNPARGYLSCVSSVLHFGLGNVEKIDSLIITWNSGRQQRLHHINTNQRIQLSEKDATEKAILLNTNSTWFTQIPSAISFKDSVYPVHDFDRQPLLICEYSHNSPVLIQYDLNGDQRDDILIGGAGEAPTRIFLQTGNGGFSEKKIPVFETDRSFEDADIVVFDANADKRPDIYVVSGGYHRLDLNSPLLEDRLYINDGNNFTRSTGIPKLGVSKSCAPAEDINGDGAPDLFIGGRLIPGRYPEIPRSYILINDGKGNFSDQTQTVCKDLMQPGMVTDAAWVDLDQDKRNELVIAGEWMPVMVFQNQNGKLTNASKQFFDKDYSGWWNKIAVADLNADNRPDLVLGNMGLNTQFKSTEKEPLELFYKDFDRNGSIDPVFSFYIQGKKYPYLTRDELLLQLPALRKRFPDFKSYADVTVDELFKNDELDDAGHLIANHMRTTVFINNGKFVSTELPKEAQYSPVYAIRVLDYNKDGVQDILLAGNNGHFKIRLGKFDANYGVLLKGDGKGNFQYVSQTESGLNIKGDVRGTVNINETVYFGITGKSLQAYKLRSQK